MRDGGGAIDAAIATTLCLAVVTPHRTSLDASGSLLYWEYRQSRTTEPTLIEWGGVGNAANINATGPPRLLVGLAALHAKLGVLSWSKLLQPAIDVARIGFNVSTGLAMAAASREILEYTAGEHRTEPPLAEYLQSLQRNTSEELCIIWSCESSVWWSSVASVLAGGWRVWTGGAGARASVALAAALDPLPLTPLEAFRRVVANLEKQASIAEDTWPTGVASGLAVVDPQDTYVALSSGLSVAFGSGNITKNGWREDIPSAPLDLAPSILVDETVCGTRYIMGAESLSALAEGAAAVLVNGPLLVVKSVESARVLVETNGFLALEPDRLLPPAALSTLQLGPPVNASLPLPALNVIQQTGDTLLSHADSRGGGVASRF
ncbi:glutathione hydrolase 6-like isoform X2 [Leptidea sinapis]|nr:glutathione hydrolase 6-like isoform X2 [Leptidea sinapis]